MGDIDRLFRRLVTLGQTTVLGLFFVVPALGTVGVASSFFHFWIEKVTDSRLIFDVFVLVSRGSKSDMSGHVISTGPLAGVPKPWLPQKNDLNH